MSISKRNSWSFILDIPCWLQRTNFGGQSTSNDDISQLACLLKILNGPFQKHKAKNKQKWMVYVNYLHSLLLSHWWLTRWGFAFSALPPGSHQQRGVLRRVQESTGWGMIWLALKLKLSTTLVDIIGCRGCVEYQLYYLVCPGKYGTNVDTPTFLELTSRPKIHCSRWVGRPSNACCMPCAFSTQSFRCRKWRGLLHGHFGGAGYLHLGRFFLQVPTLDGSYR